jgi:hypothetical protein
MALLFCDGCDAYGVAGDLVRKGWQGMSNSPVTTGFSVGTAAGGYGGGAITIPSQNNNIVLGLYGLYTYTAGMTLNMAFLFKQVGLPSSNLGGSVVNGGGLMSLSWDTPASADSFTLVTPTTAGTLQAYACGGSTVLSTGTHNVCDGAYHWIEIQYVLNTAATGSIKVLVDGVSDISHTSVATVISGSTPTGGIGIGDGTSAGASACANWYDDVIIWDNTGAAFNTFPIGQQRITTLVPNAAGDLTQFTPSAGANFAVAAQAYNAAATLTSATVGQTDLYNTTGLGGFSPASINALVMNCYASNPAGGTFTEIPKVKSLGTVASNAAIVLAAAAMTKQSVFYGDSSSAAWTPTSINAAQIGMGT